MGRTAKLPDELFSIDFSIAGLCVRRDRVSRNLQHLFRGLVPVFTEFYSVTFFDWVPSFFLELDFWFHFPGH